MYNIWKKIEKIAKHIFPLSWGIAVSRFTELPSKLNEMEVNLQTLGLALLQQEYESSSGRPEINKYEVKVYSQNGEDGILLYIFSKISTTNRCFVEFGMGDGKECNTANLSINFGWHGLLMDGDSYRVAVAKRYYKNKLGTGLASIKIIDCTVTMENINQVFLNAGIEGEIDLLSIDIDGNDYWIWKAITVITPRVVIIEYNASFGPEKSLTVKYDPKFDKYKKHPSCLYHGASLAALTKLANLKGYALVGCDSTGINAFFVKKSIIHNNLTELSVKEAYFQHSRRTDELSTFKQFECFKHLDFDYV